MSARARALGASGAVICVAAAPPACATGVHFQVQTGSFKWLMIFNATGRLGSIHRHVRVSLKNPCRLILVLLPLRTNRKHEIAGKQCLPMQLSSNHINALV